MRWQEGANFIVLFACCVVEVPAESGTAAAARPPRCSQGGAPCAQSGRQSTILRYAVAIHSAISFHRAKCRTSQYLDAFAPGPASSRAASPIVCVHIGTPCLPSLPLPLWLQAKRQGTGMGSGGDVSENTYLLTRILTRKKQKAPSRVVSVSVSFSVSQSSRLVTLHRSFHRSMRKSFLACFLAWVQNRALFTATLTASPLLPRFRCRCCFLGGFLGGYRKGSASPLSSPLARLHPGSCQAAHLEGVEGSTHKRT